MKTEERARKITQTARKDKDTVSQVMGEARGYVPTRIMKKLIRKTNRRSR